jgi:serine/threonine protein phosphatase 1
MSRLLAIGDIHGCTMQLDAIWDAVQPTPDDTIIFLGDYVDRGPDSKGVIDRLLEWKQQLPIVTLRGNHELMMLRSRESPADRRAWLQFGGNECLASYSPIPGRMGTFEHVPESHWEFLEKGIENYHETEKFVFVHAGLDPAVALEEQIERYMQWEFLEQAIKLESKKTVIVGHTSQRSGEILDLDTTICIDTNVYGNGCLTCLDLNNWHYWQANILGRIREADLRKR